MEILNLEPLKEVYVEDTLYRLDFRHSLFFGQKSGLLYKRKYINKNTNEWKCHFSDYKLSQGIMEPRFIQLKNGGENYLDITIDHISYNTEIDPEVFLPPEGCKNFDTFNPIYALEQLLRGLITARSVRFNSGT